MEWWHLAVPLLMYFGVTSAKDTDENGLTIEPPAVVAVEAAVQPLEKMYLVDVKEKPSSEIKETPSVEAEKSPYEIIENLPQWVQEVTSVCPWRSAADEHQQGYIRLIRAEKEGANQLYIQWMQKLPPNKDKALVTRVIKEIEQGPRLAIELPVQQLHSRFCKLTAYARSLENNNNYRISLKIEEPGAYQFELIQVLGRSSR